MKIFLILLSIYVLYKFIVDFVIPIYKTSKRVQEQFRNMQQNRPVDPASFGGSRVKQDSRQPKASSRDYIDFEEIKDWWPNSESVVQLALNDQLITQFVNIPVIILLLWRGGRGRGPWCLKKWLLLRLRAYRL